MKQRKFLYPALILLLSLGLGFFNLPDSLQKSIFPWTPPEITGQKISLGLDLQGGSQLDYKIDLNKVPESDRKQILDGVIGVITKRVNSLGVSEPNIYTSTIGDEQHIIVELAGITVALSNEISFGIFTNTSSFNFWVLGILIYPLN